MVSRVKITVLRHNTFYTCQFKLFIPKVLYPFFRNSNPPKLLRPVLACKLPLPSTKYHCCSVTEVCLAFTLLAYWLAGTVARWCLNGGKVSTLHFSTLQKVYAKAGYCPLFLFHFYIHDLIRSISCLNIGCRFLDVNVNLLAYADDLVLLALSWRALQSSWCTFCCGQWN